jgi:hypothetical protein
LKHSGAAVVSRASADPDDKFSRAVCDSVGYHFTYAVSRGKKRIFLVTGNECNSRRARHFDYRSIADNSVTGCNRLSGGTRYRNLAKFSAEPRNQSLKSSLASVRKRADVTYRIGKNPMNSIGNSLTSFDGTKAPLH